MNLTCPECKNDVDLSSHSGLVVGDVIECQTCGITLATTALSDNGSVSAEIVDEGK
jgi:ribosomal protein S27E